MGSAASETTEQIGQTWGRNRGLHAQHVASRGGRQGTRVRIRPRIMTTPTLGLVGCSGGVGRKIEARGDPYSGSYIPVLLSTARTRPYQCVDRPPRGRLSPAHDLLYRVRMESEINMHDVVVLEDLRARHLKPADRSCPPQAGQHRRHNDTMARCSRWSSPKGWARLHHPPCPSTADDPEDTRTRSGLAASMPRSCEVDLLVRGVT